MLDGLRPLTSRYRASSGRVRGRLDVHRRFLHEAAQLVQDELGNDFQVFSFDYAALATTWPVGDKAADCLAYYLLAAANAYQGQPRGVLAVAHSMGGIAMRSAAKVLTDTGDSDALIGFVTIATPHRGSPLGATAAAGLLQSLNEFWSIWTNNRERPRFSPARTPPSAWPQTRPALDRPTWKGSRG